MCGNSEISLHYSRPVQVGFRRSSTFDHYFISVMFFSFLFFFSQTIDVVRTRDLYTLGVGGKEQSRPFSKTCLYGLYLRR